ncbi:MAG: YhbY family RNA-binding protein [Mariprofundaceae bacterium]|nr:YhbY family RNA-binding protein [Mariprofundaceae bacterium]
MRVGQKGLTESLIAEADACLERHELIKVHKALGDAFRDDIHALSVRAQSPEEAS